MAQVLGVAAGQFGDPVAVLVLAQALQTHRAAAGPPVRAWVAFTRPLG